MAKTPIEEKPIVNHPNLRIMLNLVLYTSIVISAVIIIFGLYHLIASGLWWNLQQLSNLGQFYSGTVIALLTLATICIIALAYLNQLLEIKELQNMYGQQENVIKEQQESLRLQERGLREQKAAFRIQEKSLNEQRHANSKLANKYKKDAFENTYFKLLDMFQDIVRDVHFIEIQRDVYGIKRKEIPHQGKDAFHFLYTDLIRNHMRYSEKNNREMDIETGYLDFDKDAQFHIGHYFRILYQIFKLINNNFEDKVISLKEAVDYAIITRALLTKYELLLLFYNSLSSKGRKYFKPIIETYGIFKHIDKDELQNDKVDVLLYEASAYDLPEIENNQWVFK